MNLYCKLPTMDEGNLSPTALIPFCVIGGNTSSMGMKIDQFDVPVCNSFKEKIVIDQLCYEVDPNLYINEDIIENVKQFDLMLIIDYNEDRQLYIDDLPVPFTNLIANSLLSKLTKNPFLAKASNNDPFIYLETIGMYEYFRH